MVVYFIFLSFTILWLGILFLLPFLQTFHCFPQESINLIYSVFKVICHQKPERSYFVFGYQMPVCVRCLGIYFGLLFGAIIYPLFKKVNTVNFPKFNYLIIFTLPIMIDGISQVLNLYQSPHYLRFITGFIASTVFVFYLMPMQNLIFNRIND